MTHLHCRRRTRVRTRTRIPNPMATLYYAEHVHIAQTRTQISTPNFCVGDESEYVPVPESVSGLSGLIRGWVEFSTGVEVIESALNVATYTGPRLQRVRHAAITSGFQDH